MEDVTRNILRLTHCPRCGYKLEGLPSRGRCPECGLRYNEEMRLFPVLMHRWWLSRSARIFLGVLGAIGSVVFVIELIAQGSISVFLICLIAMCVLPLLAKRRIRKLQQFDERCMAIFFNSRGIALRKQGQLLILWPWECFDKYTFDEFETGIWRLYLSPAMWRPTVAPTFDVDLMLGSDDISITLSREIKQWLKSSRTKESKS